MGPDCSVVVVHRDLVINNDCITFLFRTIMMSMRCKHSIGTTATVTVSSRLFISTIL